MKQSLADALQQRGYETLTPVQQAVTNPDYADADLLVSAQTGSGKTVGFGLALGNTLLGDDDTFGPAGKPLALIIAPTRELAMQVKRELTWLYAGANATVASCVGGMDMRDERRALSRGAHIVVATPGRLRDHIMRSSIDLSSIRAVVLDEADEMLDLGFREDLEFILEASPETRRTLLFSATVPRTIANLAKRFQNDAIRVSTLAEKSQHTDIEYHLMDVSARDTEKAIINVLRFHESPGALVFCNTRDMVNRLTTRLSNRGFSVVSLSGELSQNERTHALQAMRDGRARVCVATDVAARGIDLPNLDLVVHADLPSNTETLLHRSGRTGRAGRKGTSVLIAAPRMRRKAERLLHTGKLTATNTPAPSAEAVMERDEARMLADDAWSQTITEAEQPAIANLLDLHAPDQIAAAFLRLYRSKQTAPEELSDPALDSRDTTTRKPFGPSTWFSITGGAKAGAEPRRILPMICKAGGIAKEDVGAIRITQDATHVEIRLASVAEFTANIGDNLQLEKGATITQIDAPAPTPRQPFRDKRAGRKSTPPTEWDDQSEPRRKKPKPTGKKPAGKKHTKRADKLPDRPEGVVTPLKKGKKPRKGPTVPTPTGKPNSKKNKARAKAAAQAKQGK